METGMLALEKFMFRIYGASKRQDNDPPGTIMDTERALSSAVRAADS
jgi:hypothetical protein